MIHLIAIITANPGQRETVLTAFRAIMPVVHAEEGCVQYEPVVDAEGAGPMQTPVGPDTFIVIERWASMAALHAHAKTTHMVNYNAETRPMIASRTLHVLSPA